MRYSCRLAGTNSLFEGQECCGGVQAMAWSSSQLIASMMHEGEDELFAVHFWCFCIRVARHLFCCSQDQAGKRGWTREGELELSEKQWPMGLTKRASLDGDLQANHRPPLMRDANKSLWTIVQATDLWKVMVDWWNAQFYSPHTFTVDVRDVGEPGNATVNLAGK